MITAMSGVLAQSGGVILAFSFIASVGSEGFVTLLLGHLGVDAGGTWLFTFKGLVVVYLYFQIPLMVLVFMPALDGVRPQWREAAESLGATPWQYWRHVAIPLLTPPFLGCTLLLFANAFAAFATAAALITQGSVIIPLQIRRALGSEVLLGQENFGKALALGMVIVVAVVMSGYTRLQRRSARWLRTGVASSAASLQPVCSGRCSSLAVIRRTDYRITWPVRDQRVSEKKWVIT